MWAIGHGQREGQSSMTSQAARVGNSTDPLRRLAQGQVMILFALASIVLIGTAALAIDVGLLLAERRQAQAAADSAAMAAAQTALDGDIAGMQAAAESYATQNAGAGATVVVNPNATGPGTADRYVEVTVTIEVQQFFLGAIYTGDWTASASAMAALEGVDGNYALITLDPNRTPGMYLNGNTGIVITGNEGGAASNSTIHGLPNTRFTADGVIHAFGNIQAGNNWSAQDIVANRQRLVPDPLLNVQPPPQGTERTFPSNCQSTCSLQPGVYRNQNFTIHGTANLVPGVYHFINSDLALRNTNSTINGNGVILHFDNASSFDPKNGNVNLRAIRSASADSEPTYQDIVIWFASCGTIDLAGNTNMFLQGIFYAPCAHVWMHGTPNSETVRGQVIVGSLDVRGTSDFRIAYEQRASVDQPAVFLVR